MKKVMTIALITILAILGCLQTVNAYSINLENQTPKEVVSGETFNLTIEVDKSTPLANGHLKYNTDLFEFVNASQSNMSAQAYINDGYVSWMYTDTNIGVKNFTFTFKAKNIKETKVGKFEVTDAIFITDDDNTYEGENIKGKNSINVTITNKKKDTDKKNNTTNKDNAITNPDKTQGKNDNTTSPDKKLPQTGKGFVTYVLILAGILLVVLKIKYKKISKLFVFIFLPVITTIMITTNVLALKLADTDNYQAGLFDSLIEGEKIIAINPGKTYFTTNDLSIEMLQSIFSEQNLTIKNIKDNEGKFLQDTEKISTGYKVVLNDKSEYTVLLYGDTDGNGTICNSADVSVIRNEYVNEKKAEGVYRLAADLSPDNVLNVKDVSLMVRKYTNKQNGPLVTPFPDDDYELPKQKLNEENVLKITSIDTTSSSAKVDINLNSIGLTSKSLTYEIYKVADGEEPVIQTKHTTLDFSELSHTFEGLTENTEYYVIVTLNCDEADYYSEQTIMTKNKTIEPENPDNPETPIDRKIEAEFIVSDVKSNKARLEIRLNESQQLQEGDKIFFGNNDGFNDLQTQYESLTCYLENLKANNEYAFWATIYDKDNNVLWKSEKITQKTAEITFDLIAEKDRSNPKDTIITKISNVSSEDTFSFGKIQYVVKKINVDEEGNALSWNTILNEEINELVNEIKIDSLTPGESYRIEVSLYDDAGNYVKKIIEKVSLDKDETPANPDNPVKPDEPEKREIKAQLNFKELTSSKAKLEILLENEQQLRADDKIYFGNRHGQDGKQNFSTSLQYEWDSLKAGDNYTFWATICDKDNNVLWNSEEINKTIPNIDYPEITVSAELNEEKPDTSIIINARENIDDKFKIKEYTILISKINENDSSYTDVKRIELKNGQLEDYIVKGLEPNTNYLISVKAKDEGGNETIETVSIKTAVAPRESIEGILEISNIVGNNVTLKINITKGEIKETDEINFSNNKTNPKDYITTKNLSYTYQDLPEGSYEFSARIIDKETNKAYYIGTISTRIMNIDQLNIEEITTSTISTRASVPSTIKASDTIIWKIEGPNNYKDKYETKLSDDSSFKYTFTGLFENTNYNVWFEVKDEAGNVMAISEKQIVKTRRELEIDLKLVSTSINKETGKGVANVELNILKGNWSDSDKATYEITALEGHLTGKGEQGGRTYTFSNLELNTKYRLMAHVYDNSNYIAYADVEVEIRNVKINSFEVNNSVSSFNTAKVNADASGVISTDKFVYEIRKKNDITTSRYDGENKTYEYKDLKPGETYCLTLKIYDKEWNLLAASKEIEYTVPSPRISVEAIRNSDKPSTQIDITVSNLEDNSKYTVRTCDIYVYRINEDESYSEVSRKLNSTTDRWTVKELLPNTNYKIVAVAKDENNNIATAETEITTAINDYTEQEAQQKPVIELNVEYTRDTDKATAIITAENPDIIDKYYYKLFKYGVSDALIPVTEQDKWIESDSNTYTFENLNQNTRYLVVVKAKSVRDKYSDGEESYEFVTTRFKPVIDVNFEKTATHVTATAMPTEQNEANIKNYHFVLVDKEHTDNQKAKYIEMSVEHNTQNSYTFTGIYPNTLYNLFGQATSQHDIMSNYQNKQVKTEIIRDTLTVENQSTTDSITVSASPSNLNTALEEIKNVGIYQLDLSSCAIYYKYIVDDGEEITQTYKAATANDAFNYTYSGLTSGKTYQVWMEIYDKDNKLIWTTKQVKTDSETGNNTETGEIVELEALKIASIEANRRQEYSLDIKVKLDEESLTRIKNNENSDYLYTYKLYKGIRATGTTVAEGTLTYGSNYNDIVGNYYIDFQSEKFYTSNIDNETYDGDVFHVDGLESDTNYTIEIIVIDANGGKSPEISENNIKTIKTRASKPEITLDWTYNQTQYESDAMDAKQLYRVGTAKVRVTNDAVIDYEYSNLSGFNFKLYKAEIISGDATRGELINPNAQTIRYRYTDDNMQASTERETLEKILAREKAADENKQTWTYMMDNLQENESYLLDVKAISRVNEESDIYTKSFKAYWNTADLNIQLTQPKATSVELDIENKSNYRVAKYTINVVEAQNIKPDDSGTILDFDWNAGTAIYAKSFGSDSFTDDAKNGNIEISDINNLDIDKNYVIIIEAQTTNGAICTHYELVDTTAIAKVQFMGNNNYYKSLQQAIDDSPRQSQVVLIKDTIESVQFNKQSREGIILTSENGAKLNKDDNNFSGIAILSETGVIIRNIEIEGNVYLHFIEGGMKPSVTIEDGVKINSNTNGLAVYTDGTANIRGKNIEITGLYNSIYNNSEGTININGITTESESEAIKLNGTITNNGNLNITSSETGTNTELFIKSNGYPSGNGIINNGDIIIRGKHIKITGEENGIINNGNLTITTVATNNESEGILIIGNTKRGIHNNGNLLTYFSENGNNVELQLLGEEGGLLTTETGSWNMDTQHLNSGQLVIDVK